MSFPLLLSNTHILQQNNASNPQLIFDEFTDVNTTLLSSHNIEPLNVPESSWIDRIGIWSIENNKAVHTLASYGHSTVTINNSNVIVECDVTLGSISAVLSDDDGIVGRWIDVNQYYSIGLNTVADVFRITYRQGGITVVTTPFVCNIGETYSIRAIFNGNSIVATVNGGNEISTNAASENTLATTFGIRATRTASRHDNFKIWRLASSLSPKTILILGDSISSPSTAWPYYIESNYNNGNNIIVNVATAGATVMGSMSNQVSSLTNQNSDIILILLGTNDGDVAGFQAEYQTNLETLKIQHPNALIYSMGILDCTSGASSSPGERDIVNGYIQNASNNVGTIYVNTDDVIDPATDTSDGLHPTNAGQNKVGAFMVTILE